VQHLKFKIAHGRKIRFLAKCYKNVIYKDSKEYTVGPLQTFPLKHKSQKAQSTLIWTFKMLGTKILWKYASWSTWELKKS
jgi:hypothetical protein